MLFCQCELQPSIILSNTTCGVNKNILLWLVVGGWCYNRIMQRLFTIDLKDYDLSLEKFYRPSVRGIILDQNGKVTMIYSEKYHFYKFPGGGIEGDETHLETLEREIKEETGMILKPESVREFGEVLRPQKVQKDRKDVVLVQSNYYYLCETENEIGTQSLDDGEKEAEFVLKFVPIDEAIQVNKNFQGEPIKKYVVERENRVLKLVKNL